MPVAKQAGKMTERGKGKRSSQANSGNTRSKKGSLGASATKASDRKAEKAATKPMFTLG